MSISFTLRVKSFAFSAEKSGGDRGDRNMDTVDTLDRLLELLSAERDEQLPRGLTLEQKAMYFRAFCNVRPPRPVSEGNSSRSRIRTCRRVLWNERPSMSMSFRLIKESPCGAAILPVWTPMRS